MHFKIPVRLLPLLLALLLILLAAPAHSAPRSTLSCTGPFARAASHAGIVKAFGAANVTSERVGVGEGEMERATVVFARDKARRLLERAIRVEPTVQFQSAERVHRDDLESGKDRAARAAASDAPPARHRKQRRGGPEFGSEIG